MKKRVEIRVAPNGALTVEAHGFKGSGCEAATKAMEDALGSTTARVRKPEHRQRDNAVGQQQQLGGGGSP